MDTRNIRCWVQFLCVQDGFRPERRGDRTVQGDLEGEVPVQGLRVAQSKDSACTRATT